MGIVGLKTMTRMSYNIHGRKIALTIDPIAVQSSHVMELSKFPIDYDQTQNYLYGDVVQTMLHHIHSNKRKEQYITITNTVNGTMRYVNSSEDDHVFKPFTDMTLHRLEIPNWHFRVTASGDGSMIREYTYSMAAPSRGTFHNGNYMIDGAQVTHPILIQMITQKLRSNPAEMNTLPSYGFVI